MSSSHPETLGALRKSPYASASLARRSVKDEVRANLLARLAKGGPLFAGVVGYEETVMPQIVNALLSRHNFILLGLRGQAKSRILRALVDAARRGDADRRRQRDQRQSVRADLEVRAHAHRRERATTRRSRGSIATSRYVEKLATPDVTIADIIGDVDPITRGARRPRALRRAHDPLRHAAAREPRHLRAERAARSRRQGAGRPVQHHAGRRRPDQRLSRFASRSTCCSASPRIPRTTRRAARSSRRSRIASAARS